MGAYYALRVHDKSIGQRPVRRRNEGGREAALWQDVYITSNYCPEKWYPRIWEENPEAKNAFSRRVNRIIHVVKGEDGEVIWKVEKEERAQIMRDDPHISPMWERTPKSMREERRVKEESILMKDEGINATGKINEEEIERSGIGLEEGEKSEYDGKGVNDSPGKGMYWGGGDQLYPDYRPLKKGRMMEELEKEYAFDSFVKK